MTSFEKVVKGACKPKAAPPKAKYLDPIIAATWSEDGAVHDVCKALSPRLREPNVIVVFKALIVLHTMIRNGSTDNVLKCLSSSDVLRLRNVSAGNWEGYDAPQNLQHYASYLDARIRAYRDLKHDAIRVQSETNRDMRNSNAIEEDRIEAAAASSRRRWKSGGSSAAPSSSVQRSKTIAGRKLRVMTVEKGLLRETKIVQKTIDALVECRFYLDDLEDELNITALRMLVKDLLILFQACNEGVINVLEHYFEMSHIDAEEALAIYRHFCKETERVVEYLAVAKKLQNLLNVPIPNLRHAPVSLAGALEEYLNDPNFEQNRIEYKTSKEAADRNARSGVKASTKSPDKQPSPKPPPPSDAATSSQPVPAKSPNNQAMVDFFTAIEGEQQSMFNPQTNSPSTVHFQQHALHNPFAHQQMQMTGAPFVQPQMQMQPTGFMIPQQTAFQQQPVSTNPFGFQGPQQQSFLQPQQTAFLQPQMTGANPFRQSMMFPQATGMSPFGIGMGAPQQSSTNPFPQNQGQSVHGMGQQGSMSAPSFNLGSVATSSSSPFAAPAAHLPSIGAVPSGPARPASAPLSALPASTSSSGPPVAQAVKTHQTGSRNPFGTPVVAAPPLPKPPTLMELAMGVRSNSQPNGTQNGQQQSIGSPGFGADAFGPPSSGQPSSSTMSSVASAFMSNNSKGGQSPTSPLSTQPTSTTFSDSVFSSLPNHTTGATASSAPSISISSASSPLQPQTTGFAGIKPFKPSSSFGAALFESLPPIPQSAPTTPSESPNPTANGGTTSPTANNGFPGLGSQPTGLGFGGLNTQPTGALTGLGTSSLGVGLRPQTTGAGAANPFRASMFAMSPAMTGAPFGSGSAGASSFLSSSSTSALGGSPFGLGSHTTGAPAPFGASQFGMGIGAGQDASKPQQNGVSLI
ncbi:ANTH-domain-containing protein [Sparassis crispa]|uniref:ANTH-domain-containing protein n=1 Tax=Sparassis crispa TaxID=139825 RepID=A0A401GVN0_9APHY|nr:ANTH-domain-containing protein [Sparassis crispa]GBE86242.1 ANTH-domain-containing protein [Sparassis crispa]